MDQESIYIGNRYVPKLEGEWNQLKEYEGLSIVTINGNSYTSKKRVPEGVAISNSEYWVKSGDSNGELIEFKEEVTAQLAQTELKKLDKNVGAVTSSDLSQEVKEQMTGGSVAVFGRNSILSENIVENQVIPSRTSFAKGGGGINLFDGIWHPTLLSGAGNFIVQSGQQAKSAILRVKSETTYRVYKSKDTNRFRLGVFSEYPENNKISTGWREFSSSNDSGTIETGLNDKYLVVTVSNDEEGKKPSEFQISEGNEVKPYVPINEKLIMNLDKKSIPQIDLEMTGFSRRSSNLFDGTFQHGIMLYSTGEIGQGSWDNSPNTRTTNKIPCEPNEDYVLSGGYNRSVWRFEDVDGERISGTTNTVIKTPSNARFMYVYYSSDGTHEKIQIEKGVEPSDYKNNYVIEEHYLPEINTKRERRVLLGDNGKKYEVQSPHIEWLGNDILAFYNLYDDLMASFPEYITKSEIGRSALDSPIYRYDFKPFNTRNQESKPVKIYLNTGTHGHEKWTMYGTLMFLKDLCEKWKEQQPLRFIRGNVHLIVVPSLNPDGFNLHQRKNGNNVDLNRNFPADWTYNSDSDSLQYTGEEPASEPETQVMMELLSTEKDLLFAIDYHNYNTFPPETYTTWVGADNPNTLELMKRWGMNYDLEMRQEFPVLENHDKHLVAVLNRQSAGTYNGATSRYMESLGLNAVTLESVTSIGTTFEEANKFNADVVGNFVLSVLRGHEMLY